MTPALPVTVLGGYLGAGKTTIVNGVLNQATERIAVLVNDFGDIAIDADLIETDGDDLITLANGCICCSLVDGFAATLAQIREFGSPFDRLLIETSGVSNPATVAAYAMTPGFVLDAIIVAADVETVSARVGDRYVGQTVRSQLDQADLIIATKVDLVTPESADETIAWLGESLAAPVVLARHGEVPLEALFGVARSEEPPVSVPVDDAQFASATWIGAPLSRAELDALIDALPPEVIRAKGIACVAGDPATKAVVNVVGERREVIEAGRWPDESPESRLVAIGLANAANAIETWASVAPSAPS